jgi:hypothetical protein
VAHFTIARVVLSTSNAGCRELGAANIAMLDDEDHATAAQEELTSILRRPPNHFASICSPRTEGCRRRTTERVRSEPCVARAEGFNCRECRRVASIYLLDAGSGASPSSFKNALCFAVDSWTCFSISTNSLWVADISIATPCLAVLT